MVESNYHAVLGVPNDASTIDIKRAFRRLAHRYHPDKTREAGASEKFAEISHAYSMLMKRQSSASNGSAEPSTRSSKAESSKSESSKTEPLKPERRKPEPPKHDEPIEMPGHATEAKKPCKVTVSLTVEQLYWGTELKINPAAACPGKTGKRNSQCLLKVKIPRGTRAGQSLRISDGPPGCDDSTEIQLRIALKKHDRYEVVGDDLYIDMPLSAWEAKHGAIVDVVTPGGRMEVEVPAGISSGQSVRIPQRGLGKAASGAGDLMAVARVVSTSQRARPMYKWPHLSHATSSPWHAINTQRTGNTVNVFA